MAEIAPAQMPEQEALGTAMWGVGGSAPAPDFAAMQLRQAELAAAGLAPEVPPDPGVVADIPPEVLSQMIADGTIAPEVASQIAQAQETPQFQPLQAETPAPGPGEQEAMVEQEAVGQVDRLKQLISTLPRAKQGAVLRRLAELQGQAGGAHEYLAEQLNQTLGVQQRAADLQEQVDAVRARADLTGALNRQEAQLTYERQARELEMRKRAATDRADMQLQAARDEFEILSRQGIRPNPIFIVAQTMTTIGNAIGMGMGAAAGILAGTGGNAVAPLAAMISRQIDKAIDRDLQAQRFGIRAAGERVKSRQSALDDLRRRFGDESQALKAQRVLAIESAQAALEREMAEIGAGDEAQQAVALRVKEELALKHAKSLADVYRGAMAAEVPALQLRAQIAAQQAQIGLKQHEMLAKHLAAKSETPGRMDGPGFAIQVKKEMPTKMESQLRERVFGLSRMGTAVDNAMAKLKTLDTGRLGKWTGDELGELRQLQAEIINASRFAESSGANFTEAEMKLALENYLGGFTVGGVDWYKGILKVLGSTKRILKDRGKSMAGAYSDYVDYRETRLPSGVSRQPVEAPPVQGRGR